MNEPKAIMPVRVERVAVGDQARFLPVMCMQCEQDTPCVSVCPQQAVEVDRESGIVFQMPQRCLGCRYCMTACPYHARYFNWRDPAWPEGMETTLNPRVSPRMRGVVEKCNFCHARLQSAQDQAAASGKQEIDATDYVPACVEACPTKAITFGDLADANSNVARISRDPHTFRLLEMLGTEPKVYYRSELEWVRELAQRGGTAQEHADRRQA
jgi:molybdopterin-containing oxidoreductase family iron-sulfur binding subunit